MRTFFILASIGALVAATLSACNSGSEQAVSQPDPIPDPISTAAAPLIGGFTNRATFRNPYGHIPAQCYIETSHGTQNACLFCHTNGPFLEGLGNNSPQAGYEPLIGDLQREYAFVALNYPFTPNGSIMPWENTLTPEKLSAAVDALNIDPAAWDMEAYVREDNWSAAYAQRPGSPLDWDPGVDAPMRLLPGLDPADLPADPDGFVRSEKAGNGHFFGPDGFVTGWRAINFMPYGIFTPLSGSVSGIYIRLPTPFMRNSVGDLDLAVYRQNLDLLERAIQGRLDPEDPETYFGGASSVAVTRGLYPVGTELAHPLHYVDVAADGSDPDISPFPGTRSRRVKEVRYMYKYKPFYPDAAAPGNKVEDAPIYANSQQGWADNGVGWYLSAYIEQADGSLRPQSAAELTQCVGCHSGTALPTKLSNDEFSAGTGNTIDSTWSLPRKFAGDAGWREMDYLGYTAQAGEPTGRASVGDPVNRKANTGEFRLFLEHVVGASLYGDMPGSMESFLAERIAAARGYSADWPALDSSSPEILRDTQQLRQRLVREMTLRREYLDLDGTIQGALLYPPAEQALAGAARYRQVVVTQRYDLGKDVFATTPFTYLYYRTDATAFAHQNGDPYQPGEVISDRPIDTEVLSLTNGFGVGDTLIDPDLPFEQGGTYMPDYVPVLAYPPVFE